MLLFAGGDMRRRAVAAGPSLENDGQAHMDGDFIHSHMRLFIKSDTTSQTGQSRASLWYADRKRHARHRPGKKMPARGLPAQYKAELPPRGVSVKTARHPKSSGRYWTRAPARPAPES